MQYFQFPPSSLAYFTGMLAVFLQTKGQSFNPELCFDVLLSLLEVNRLNFIFYIVRVLNGWKSNKVGRISDWTRIVGLGPLHVIRQVSFGC